MISTLISRLKQDIFTTYINIKMASILFIKCIYMFCMNLPINNNNFYDQHEEYDICNGNALCLNELNAY
jgi:Pyruvate/2-oxoacid:ferredoxin oxidoreductase delta subunit